MFFTRCVFSSPAVGAFRGLSRRAASYVSVDTKLRRCIVTSCRTLSHSSRSANEIEGNLNILDLMKTLTIADGSYAFLNQVLAIQGTVFSPLRSEIQPLRLS